MRDAVILATLVLTFAGAITLHLLLVFGLARRSPRIRGLIALVVPPLAPYWGFREHMRGCAIAWIACVVLYGVARLVASRG